VVSYAPDLDVLRQTLDSVTRSVVDAKERGSLTRAELYLVDNGPGDEWTERLSAVLAPLRADGALEHIELVTGHGNIGFGPGSNLAMTRSDAEFCLVLNPDVTMEPEAIDQGLSYLAQHQDALLVTPRAVWPDGTPQYLCKRYPTVFDLFLRGFAPEVIKRAFRRRLDSYEMRDVKRDAVTSDVPIASGCFMLVRRAAWQRVGGFDPAYFLYFEDFDLSVRIRRAGKIAYVPSVRITHRGGGAARKNWRHIRLFVGSAWVFFNHHGWRWW